MENQKHSYSLLEPTHLASFIQGISSLLSFHNLRAEQTYSIISENQIKSVQEIKTTHTLFDTDTQNLVLPELTPVMVFQLQLFNRKNSWAFPLFSSWEKLQTLILAALTHKPQTAPSKPEIISYVLTAAFLNDCNITSHCRLWKKNGGVSSLLPETPEAL